MTTTAQGAAKVAQANAQAQSGAVGGAVTSSGGLTTGGNANPKDAPGYVPGSSVDDKVGPITAMTSSIDSAIKSTGTQATPQLDPNAQAPQGLVDQVGQLQKQTSALAAQKNLTPNTQPTTAGSYQQAKTLADKSGVPPPQNAGALAAGSSQFLGSTNSAPTLPASIENFLSPESPAVEESTKKILEWLNPEADRQMLNDHIKQLSSDRAELAGLKTDLMNTKRVMEGTEQDLRDEVTKAGGFATNSQVQALSIARNKSLLQKAQLISDQIQSQTDLVNSDVSLVGDEKQMAAQQFTQRMSLLNYQQENARNQQNAIKDTFKTVVDALGYDGAYLAYQNDPVQLQRIEQISGLGTDGLKKAAEQAYQKRLTEENKVNLQNQVLESNLKTDSLQRDNIQSQINERNNPSGGSETISGKPQTASQTSANGYANRLNEANVVIGTLGGNFTSKTSFGGSMPNILQSGDRQAYEQAKRNFVNAVLRRESGAAISPSEFSSAEKQYFPQAGDKENVVKQKESSRNTAINNLYRESNVNRPVMPGQVIQANGKKYKVGSDGETLTEIK